VETQQLPAILFCTQLEKHLVVGAYNMVCKFSFILLL
jgi:hypothetical protein